MKFKSLLNLNDNVLCAITIRTTGIRPNYHDLLEICIYPLDEDIKPDKNILPFNFVMQLKRPENISMEEKLKFDTGIDPWTIADMFEEWVKRLQLPFRKRIIPLSPNWAFARGFILDWLGDNAFETFIDDYQARDIHTVVHYINDKANFETESIPFAKTNLRFICSVLKIHSPIRNNTLWESVTLAEAYRTICLGRY